MSKCERCANLPDGRNGSGYMPCGCRTKSKIDNTDLNNLLKKAIEVKPEFVEPPPLISISLTNDERQRIKEKLISQSQSSEIRICDSDGLLKITPPYMGNQFR